MKKSLIGILVIVLVLGTAVPAFSQEILATFGAGVLSLSFQPYSEFSPVFTGREDYTYEPTYGLASFGVNVLFIGKSGFTISLGSDFAFNIDQGITYALPAFGLGYVYYDKFYIGGIINIIPIGISGWDVHYGSYEYNGDFTDGFIAPTLVGGYDFDGFVLGAQLSYMRGVYSGVDGFKFSIGAGVNLSDSR